MSFIPDGNHKPEENGVAEKVRGSLYLEALPSPGSPNYTAIGMELRFIPVTPELEAWIGLIADPEPRALLSRFVLNNTQCIYSKQLVDLGNFEGLVPETVDLITRDIKEFSLDRLMDELKKIFAVKVDEFDITKED